MDVGSEEWRILSFRVGPEVVEWTVLGKLDELESANRVERMSSSAWRRLRRSAYMLLLGNVPKIIWPYSDDRIETKHSPTRGIQGLAEDCNNPLQDLESHSAAERKVLLRIELCSELSYRPWNSRYPMQKTKRQTNIWRREHCSK